MSACACAYPDKQLRDTLIGSCRDGAQQLQAKQLSHQPDVRGERDTQAVSPLQQLDRVRAFGLELDDRHRIL